MVFFRITFCDRKGPFGGQKYLHFVTFCDRKRTFWWSKNTGNTGKYQQIIAGIGIGIWSPEYRYSGIGIPDWKH
jgi:hypothetical protein